ncbi:MAG: HD domain-containing protein [Kouleothrix sp.]|nr:HD domain-containing protein [Kouleothrix sp.]
MEQHIADLLIHPKVLETREHMHHSIPKHDHLLRSVRFSSRFARLLRADERVCLRAAIIHDIDSRLGTLTTHGAVAARWAAAQGEPNEVCAAIISHMYPLGPRPTTREGWVLVLADKAASMGDFAQYLRGLVNGSSRETRRRLEQSDPFYRDRPLRRPRRPLLRNRTRLLRRRRSQG